MRDIEQTPRGKAYRNLTANALLQKALLRKEGKLASNRALTVTTGGRTELSLQDRFIVRDKVTENKVAWGKNNQAISSDRFETLWQLAKVYLQSKESFISNLAMGSNEAYQIPITVKTDLAWHQLFCHFTLIRTLPSKQPENFWTLLNVTGLKTDPTRDGVNSDAAVLVDFTHRRILLCGLYHAGEMKKILFFVMNFLMPSQRVFPMNCAASMGHDRDTALFFGLSDVDKTTLSIGSDRYLIGIDEHGWGDSGVFNFEGGCYVKGINLSQEREPIIWHAVRDGAVMENVVLDEATSQPQFNDDTLTQNMHVAFPLEYITRRVKRNRGAHPKTIIFLTCDLYGVLPPVAKLSKEQAAYYYLSGYTALVGGNEMSHRSEIKPIFGTYFDALFFPHHPEVYANLLLERLEKTPCSVYLVNTGWTGGAYGEGGNRFNISTTRTLIHAILDHELDHADYETLAGFNLAIPCFVQGVDSIVLNPRNSWKNTAAYDHHACQLMEAFVENFMQFQMPPSIIRAGPQL